MKFVTSNITKKDEEIEHFLDCLNYYPNLFHGKKQIEVESHIYNYIDQIYVYNDSKYIEKEFYGEAIKKENGQFTIKYVTGEDIKANRFNTTHELGHVLLTPIDYNDINIGKTILPAQGPCKYNARLSEFYGLGICEGTINMLVNISMLKKDEPMLLENYIKNGGVYFKESKYRPLEEISRMLTVASVPCCENPIKYLTELIKNQKIDDKTSSTYLTSSFNNDFEFEKEFDSIIGEEYSCYNLYKDIDIIHKQIISKENIDNNLLENIFERINTYYIRKINNEAIRGKLDQDKLIGLQIDFNDSIEKIFSNLKIEREKRNEI